MSKRLIHKEESLHRILQAGATRIRREGLSGSAIATIMQDAGLTHGTFYSHFNNKNELLIGSLRQALADNRPRWISGDQKESWTKRLARLAKRYLTPAHRDDLANSCALATLSSETARAENDFKQSYEEELQKSLEAICGEKRDRILVQEQYEDALVFMALCIGGMNLSRAVESDELSDQILTLCSKASERITTGDIHSQEGKKLMKTKTEMGPTLDIDQFPGRSYEKLRYSDTDRQGHVNNAVFSTMLETGRVEILYNSEKPLAKPNCSFVIARQTLNYHREINWPGTVEIGTRVQKLGRSSITFEQIIVQDNETRASAVTIIVQMNESTRKSDALDDKALEHLKAFMVNEPPQSKV